MTFCKHGIPSWVSPPCEDCSAELADVLATTAHEDVNSENELRTFLSNTLHVFVYGQMAPSVSDSRIDAIVSELMTMRNAP